MKMRALVSILIGLLIAFQPFAARSAQPINGIVATGHPIATKAAVDAMKRGGNAIDAAVSAALTLGVVDGFNSGLGGGCFLLIRRTNGAFNAIDGRETAPAAASRNMFIRNGKADTELSQAGALAVAVPGALAAYDLALRRYGKLPLKDHLLAAAKIADEGFPVSNHYADVLQGQAPVMSRFEGTRAVFFKTDGKPYKAGEVLKQPDLAKTYRAIAEKGIGWFYAGSFAEATAAWMKTNGGILTIEDFRNYRPVFREPIFMNYRGAYTLACFPPPSSGGVLLLQVANMLETRNLKQLGTNPVDLVHFVAEAMKLGFADRAHWLGDPDFVKVPRGLIKKNYARHLAAQIKLDAVSKVPGHGTPEQADTDVFQKHTTHFSAADAEGNWVACTATINTSFGSKVVIPGTGVIMNNEMDDFSIEPGVANYFNLVGAEANAVAPGKRPLSSMTPTIVLKEGQPILATGGAGGPTIISQTILNIVNFLDLGLDLKAAVCKPRFHHQWSPDYLRVEEAVDPEICRALEKRGHTVKPTRMLGVSHAVARTPDGKGFVGAADSRGEGTAEGW